MIDITTAHDIPLSATQVVHTENRPPGRKGASANQNRSPEKRIAQTVFFFKQKTAYEMPRRLQKIANIGSFAFVACAMNAPVKPKPAAVPNASCAENVLRYVSHDRIDRQPAPARQFMTSTAEKNSSGPPGWKPRADSRRVQTSTFKG